jgi:hypothetical protein
VWFPERYRQLARVEIGELARKLLELPEELWLSDQVLQKKIAGDRDTNSIFLLSLASVDFEPLIEKRSISVADVPRGAGWEVLHEVVDPLVAQAIAHFPAGGVVTRVQLARMQPGCEITPHTDVSLILMATHRLHVPVVTNSHVDFRVTGERVILEEGNLYEVNNRVQHSVVNGGDAARVHLIVDYLPPENNKTSICSRNFEARNKQLAANTGNRPRVRRDTPLPTVIATSVVRGAHKHQSHGGVYLVDMENGKVDQVVEWNNCDIDGSGRGWDRGLRGIAFHNDRIYIAASDELYCFDQKFNVLASFRSPYLKHAHEIVRFNDHLLVTSTGFDSILRFDLATQVFDKGWCLRQQSGRIMVSLFDPRQTGPEPANTLHLNGVYQDSNGIYASGRQLPSVLRLNQGVVHRYCEIPLGTHNALPFGDGGILYQDTVGDLVVFHKDEEFASVAIPRYPEEALVNGDLGDDRLARQGFGRGLCVYQDGIVLAGSSPATITAIDLLAAAPIKSVNITMDIRNAIHGLEVWPF